MTKEEAIKYLQQLYPNGGHCWLDEQRIDAIDIAVKSLKEEPVERSEEDEEIRKLLIKYHRSTIDINGVPGENIIAWLEKQGDREPVDKVEPKFKVGDWVASNICNSSDLLRIIDVDGKDYEVETPQGNTGVPSIAYVDSNFHLWTIQDAKDGDVLYHKAENGIEYIVMNKGLNEHNNIDSYFRYSSINGFGIDIPSVLSAKFDSITPATKEQRDLLFQKMNEAGFEWDAEKKELKKIKQKPVWSEEDEEMFQSVMIDCFYCGDFPDYPTREEQELYDEAMDKINWLKSLKNRVGCEANFTTAKEWNEEDEHRIKDTIYFLDTAKKHYASTEELDACINWLKSLKGRMQKGE